LAVADRRGRPGAADQLLQRYFVVARDADAVHRREIERVQIGGDVDRGVEDRGRRRGCRHPRRRGQREFDAQLPGLGLAAGLRLRAGRIDRKKPGGDLQRHGAAVRVAGGQILAGKDVPIGDVGGGCGGSPNAIVIVVT
jgi:hypothetical protein